MKTLEKIQNGLSKAVSFLIAMTLIVMVFVIFLQVLVRFFKGALPWSEELARYLQIYLTLLGVSVAIKNKNLISVDILFKKTGSKGQKILEDLRYFFMTVSLIFMGYSSWTLIQMTMKQVSPVLSIPMGVVYFSVLLGCFLGLVQNLLNFFLSRKGSNPLNKRANKEDIHV